MHGTAVKELLSTFNLLAVKTKQAIVLTYTLVVSVLYSREVFLNRQAAARYRGPGINYTRPREFVILVF
jgi:hypothetical protein